MDTHTYRTHTFVTHTPRMWILDHISRCAPQFPNIKHWISQISIRFGHYKICHCQMKNFMVFFPKGTANVNHPALTFPEINIRYIWRWFCFQKLTRTFLSPSHKYSLRELWRASGCSGSIQSMCIHTFCRLYNKNRLYKNLQFFIFPKRYFSSWAVFQCN